MTDHRSPASPAHQPVVKPKWVGFDWSYKGYSGLITAVSFAGAVEKAHKDYLLKCNIGPRSQNYRSELQLLRDRDSPFAINLSDQAFERFRRLYRDFKDGDLTSKDGLADLKQFQSIIRDKEAHNARHFPAKSTV